MGEPRVVRGDALSGDTTQTGGIQRLEAFAGDGVWAGRAHTAPGVTSGWHHHGSMRTYVWVVSGRLRLESGPGGRDVVEAGPGDFAEIPPETVHRESNPSTEEAVIILVRVGEGEPVVNVEGPDPEE